MWNAAELVRQPGTDVRFHALLGSTARPSAGGAGRLPGFTIHSLDELLPPHAKCLLQGLQASSYSQGRALKIKKSKSRLAAELQREVSKRSCAARRFFLPRVHAPQRPGAELGRPRRCHISAFSVE